MSIVTPKLKAIYKCSIFSLTDLAYVKNQYNLTDWGVFIATKFSLKHDIGLDHAALLSGNGIDNKNESLLLMAFEFNELG